MARRVALASGSVLEDLRRLPLQPRELVYRQAAGEQLAFESRIR